jgi:hypothetical protein
MIDLVKKLHEVRRDKTSYDEVYFYCIREYDQERFEKTLTEFTHRGISWCVRLNSMLRGSNKRINDVLQRGRFM